MPTENAKEIALGVLAKQVLNAGLLEDTNQSTPSEAILDEYEKNPSRIHQRYLLVTTWSHAAQIFKSVSNWSGPQDRVIDSNSLTALPENIRLDAWNTPYCIWVGSKQVVFISSGGHGSLECDALQKTAQDAAAASRDPRLTKFRNVLVSVQSKEDQSASLSQ